MIKLKMQKKTIIAASYTLVLLVAIIFATHPITNSFFAKNVDKALAYNSKLGVYDNIKLNCSEVSTSDLEKYVCNIALSPDGRFDNELYNIKANSFTQNSNSVCTINYLNNSNIETSIINDDEYFQIKNKNLGLETIQISCPIIVNETNKEDINIAIKVYEKVNSSDKFLYKEGNVKLDYNEYYDRKKPVQSDNVIRLDETDPYKKFMDIINLHISGSKYAGDHNITKEDVEDLYINEYAGITSTTAKDKLLLAKDFFLPGVTRREVTLEDGTKGYEFIVDNNFLGYYKTKQFYNSSPGDEVYFSSTKSSEIKKAFELSLSTWGFRNTTKEEITIDGITKDYTKAEMVSKYVEKYLANNQLDYSLDNLAKVPGLSKGAKNNFDYLYVDYYLFNDAYNYLTKDSNIITLNYSTEYLYNGSISNIIYAFQDAVYFNQDENIANTLKNLISNTDPESYASFNEMIMCTNCTDSKYEIYHIGNKYVFIEVTYKEEKNEIRITSTDMLEIPSKYISESTISKINNILKDENSSLKKAIVNIAEYHEIHYNVEEGNYYLVNISPRDEVYDYDNKVWISEFVKIDITKKDSFIEAVSDKLVQEKYKNITESLNISLIEGNLGDEIIYIPDSTDNFIPKYYEIHYSNDKYYLIDVTRDINTKYNTIKIIEYDKDDNNISEELKNIISNLDVLTIYIKTSEIEITNSFITYIKSQFGSCDIEAIDGYLYSTMYFY